MKIVDILGDNDNFLELECELDYGLNCIIEGEYDPGQKEIRSKYSSKDPIGLIDPGEPPIPESFNIFNIYIISRINRKKILIKNQKILEQIDEDIILKFLRDKFEEIDPPED